MPTQIALAALVVNVCSLARAEVVESDLRRDVRYLASDELAGRPTGGAGQWKAARYIMDRFERLGLSAVGGDGYLQRFGFATSVAMGDGTQLSWDGSLWGRPTDILPLGHSAAQSAQGDIVFAGYGPGTAGTPEGTGGAVDVAGRIALVLSGGPGGGGVGSGSGQSTTSRAKVAAAAAQGAAGLILVRTDQDGPMEAPQPFDTSGRVGPIPAVSISRGVAIEKLGSDWAAVFSEDRPAIDKRLGRILGRGALTADLHEVRTETANVAGLLVGRDPDLMWETVIVGAHYDHVGVAADGRVNNGADDNASGVSGVLALAQELAARRQRPKRSILFIAFSGEELGLLGSRHYAALPLLPLARTRAMVNLDMVGRLRDNSLMVFGSDSGAGMAALVDGAASRHGLSATFGGRAPAGSDHEPFMEAGIPSLFLFTGVHSQYHTPDDDWQHLNYLGLAQVLNAAADLIENLANTDLPPAWVPPAAPVARGYLGVVASVDAGSSRGFTIGSIIAGGPAAGAGLAAGDVITEMNGEAVETAADLLQALGRLGVGTQVRLVVERAGVRYECEATLGPAR